MRSFLRTMSAARGLFAFRYAPGANVVSAESFFLASPLPSAAARLLFSVMVSGLAHSSADEKSAAAAGNAVPSSDYFPSGSLYWHYTFDYLLMKDAVSFTSCLPPPTMSVTVRMNILFDNF